MSVKLFYTAVTVAKEIGKSNAQRRLANILPELAHVDILLLVAYVTTETRGNVTSTSLLIDSDIWFKRTSLRDATLLVG